MSHLSVMDKNKEYSAGLMDEKITPASMFCHAFVCCIRSSNQIITAINENVNKITQLNCNRFTV